MSREIKFRAWDGIQMLSNHEINGDWLLSNRFEHIIPMQFTGLKDKNGKDIYEGDIMDYGGGRVFYITYVGCQFLATFSERVVNSIIPIYQFKVIGNIYETPHLLTEQLIKKEEE